LQAKNLFKGGFFLILFLSKYDTSTQIVFETLLLDKFHATSTLVTVYIFVGLDKCLNMNIQINRLKFIHSGSKASRADCTTYFNIILDFLLQTKNIYLKEHIDWTEDL